MSHVITCKLAHEPTPPVWECFESTSFSHKRHEFGAQRLFLVWVGGLSWHTTV